MVASLRQEHPRWRGKSAHAWLHRFSMKRPLLLDKADGPRFIEEANVFPEPFHFLVLLSDPVSELTILGGAREDDRQPFHCPSSHMGRSQPSEQFHDCKFRCPGGSSSPAEEECVDRVLQEVDEVSASW